jgi:hypothetical protein
VDVRFSNHDEHGPHLPVLDFRSKCDAERFADHFPRLHNGRVIGGDDRSRALFRMRAAHDPGFEFRSHQKPWSDWLKPDPTLVDRLRMQHCAWIALLRHLVRAVPSTADDDSPEPLPLTSRLVDDLTSAPHAPARDGWRWSPDRRSIPTT